MRKIIVYDVPAIMGGALTILNEFYDEALRFDDIQWIFVVSTPQIQSQKNVTVKYYPWVKKSWVHRLYFDYFVAWKIAKEVDAEKVFSLQNVTIKRCKLDQILYVHQPLPFSDEKFKIKDGIIYWVYQNLIARDICKSINKSNLTIVQTKWMKDSIMKKIGIPKTKIKIVPPMNTLDTDTIRYNSELKKNVFFYPVAPNAYKNHRVIIRAVKWLLKHDVKDFEVLFTTEKTDLLDGESIKGLEQIKCIGRLSHEKVLQYFQSSVLIFPSKIETYGLPLLEAATVKAPVLAGDKPFSHEILDTYPNVRFFNVDDYEHLAIEMMDMIDGSFKYCHDISQWSRKSGEEAGWKPILKVLSGDTYE